MEDFYESILSGIDDQNCGGKSRCKFRVQTPL